MATADAVAAAEEANLDWTVHCSEDPARPEGIIHQEPAAGTTVERGSPLALYSARFSDCQG
jgi:beta-lactam-binding protein with PASTA domain